MLCVGRNSFLANWVLIACIAHLIVRFTTKYIVSYKIRRKYRAYFISASFLIIWSGFVAELKMIGVLILPVFVVFIVMANKLERTCSECERFVSMLSNTKGELFYGDKNKCPSCGKELSRVIT